MLHGSVFVETCRRIIKPADDIDFYDLLGLDITTIRFREVAPFAVDTNETIRVSCSPTATMTNFLNLSTMFAKMWHFANGSYM